MSEHVADLIEAYVHGLADGPTAEHIRAHCETCPVCREALDQARARLARLKAVPGVKASPQLVQTTMQRARMNVRKRSWRTRVAWTAVAAVAAAALFLLGANIYVQHIMEPTPYDLIVLGQRELLASTNASLRIRLVNRKTNVGVAGARGKIEFVHPETRKVEQFVTFTTDAEGSGQTSIPIKDTSGDFDLRVSVETPKGPEVVEDKIHIVRPWKIMLSSDKPVYQPGQTIHVRALALNRIDLKPAHEEKTVFTIADPRSNIIFKYEGQTSRFGIDVTDCQLGQEILEGDYVLTCKIGDAQARQRVEVKKYVLPKFKVDLSFDRPFYQPGDKVKATVHADYFFGKPVANGAVEVQLTGADKHKWTEHTNEQGVLTLDYDIPKTAAERDHDANLEFEVKITDAAGQRATAMAERRVTRDAVRLEVLPENTRFVDGLRNRVYVLTTMADGRPVPLRITLSMGDWQVLETTTNEAGAGVFDIVPSPQWQGTAIIRAVTPKSLSPRLALGCGLEASRGLDGEGTVLARKRMDLSGNSLANDFLLRTDKPVYTAGDLLTVRVLSATDEAVFVDLLKEGQTLQTGTIAPTFVGSWGTSRFEVPHAEGKCEFQLPVEMAGTLELCAYRLGGAKEKQKTRIVYVRAAEDVQITTTIDDKPYRPGQQAKLNFRLTDSKGQPVQGALSLAAVDEAVFSVMRQRPGMERDFYSMDPELLASVNKVGAWSPAREEGVDPRANALRDQALFAAAANEGVARRNDAQAQTTRPAKETEMAKIRLNMGEWIGRGWIALIVLSLLLGYGLFWLYVQVQHAFTVIKLHAVLAMMLVLGILLFLCWSQVLGRIAPSSRKLAAGGEGDDFTVIDYSAIGGGDGAPPDRHSRVRSIAAGNDEHLSQAEWIMFRKTAMDRGVGALNGGLGEPARVREYFPETLRWEPQLITDEQGRTSLDLELADSITSWRLGASAVTADGRLGATQKPLKVFQPFFVDLNLPVSLTRGDEVAVPVVVYNYLDKPQTVVLTLADGDWFTRIDAAEKQVALAPGQVLATSYRLRIEKVGDHALTVTARGGDVTDAIKRTIAVLPNGRRFEEVSNGSLNEPVSVSLDVPQSSIEGSAHAVVKIYPSSFSQLVEGLDGIFQMPSGCFEQASSSTYPNILALDYLRRTNLSQPEVEKRATQYIHLGYQRLLSFEVPGGGFDWFGHAPANRTLTAYGLMEFEDMARVHAIDPDVITRTRDWLLKQRNKNGSWTPEGHVPHDTVEPTGDEAQEYLAATAYIALAVYADPKTKDADGRTRSFLLSYTPEEITSPHTLALVCNALLLLDPKAATKYLDRLESVKTTANVGHAFWAQPKDARTTFHGAGRSGNVETTALAALALQQDTSRRATANAALAWLVTQKDARGTWHSTQATVLSLKALLAGTNHGQDNKERRLEVRLGDAFVEQIVIPANQSEVMAQLDLSKHLKPGRQQLTLKETTDTAAGYQVMFRYNLDDADKMDKADRFGIDLAYEKTELTVGDVVKVKAKVTNRMAESAAMVMLDLPVPAGFGVVLDEFEQLQEKGIAAKFQVLPQSVLVYLRDLPAGKPLEVTYRLRSTMAVKITASGARVYEYYDPDRQGRSPATRIEVKAAQ